jgi:HD-GYP domain-containing protein (c-di-GMP phosphodiesterase class II)
LLKLGGPAADSCPTVPELKIKDAPRAGASERKRRAEAVQRQRADTHARSVAAAGELARLRDQLRVAAELNARLARHNDPDELGRVVVDALHENFAFYLAAVQRLDEDGSLRLVAARGPLAEVMAEFLLTEQPVTHGVNGRVARTGVTALITETREDPDYIVRDPKTDPRSEISVAIFVEDRVWGVVNIEAVEPGALRETDVVLVEAVAAGLGSALHRSRLVAELESAFTTTLAILTSTVEAKDDYTASHGEDVAELAERVALQMGLSGGQARDVRLAAMLHDVGKIAVPSEILLKPGPLTDEEWVVMRRHAAVGGDLVARIDAFAHLAPAVRSSHERWDGGGYPDGLAAEAIPLSARIISACDTYDAIVTDRPYRPGRTAAEARAELERVAGSQLDPVVVRALIAVFDRS